MKTRIIAAVALASTVSVLPLSAHHTAAYLYDVQKPVELKGTVTEVERKNPHVIVHVDVTVCTALDGSHKAELRSFNAPDGVKLVGQC